MVRRWFDRGARDRTLDADSSRFSSTISTRGSKRAWCPRRRAARRSPRSAASSRHESMPGMRAWAPRWTRSLATSDTPCVPFAARYVLEVLCHSNPEGRLTILFSIGRNRSVPKRGTYPDFLLSLACREMKATAGWLDAQEGESALRNLRTRPDETAIVGRAAVSPLENCASGYEINRVWASQHDQPPTLRPGPVQTLA